MKTVFLDRDGTVIAEPPDEQVDAVEKIELYPDTLEALKYLADNDFNVILVTNQPCVARGLITEAEFQTINAEILKRLEPSGVKILKTYMCPHIAEDGCECRKPKPTMLQWAAKDFGLNLADMYMVGDRQTDVMTGINAGTKTVLIKTANSPVESKEADYTAPSLLNAVKYVVANS